MRVQYNKYNLHRKKMYNKYGVLSSESSFQALHSCTATQQPDICVSHNSGMRLLSLSGFTYPTQGDYTRGTKCVKFN
jgi:hypothetical protein